jgi:hypothetical protein
MKIKVENIWEPVTLTYTCNTEADFLRIIVALKKSPHANIVRDVIDRLCTFYGDQERYPMDLKFTFENYEELRTLRTAMGDTAGGFDFYKAVKGLFEMVSDCYA